MELCAAEHALELHETGALCEMLVRGDEEEGLGLSSQSMQLKGVQGNQTRSLPVSM